MNEERTANCLWKVVICDTNNGQASQNMKPLLTGTSGYMYMCYYFSSSQSHISKRNLLMHFVILSSFRIRSENYLLPLYKNGEYSFPFPR